MYLTLIKRFRCYIFATEKKMHSEAEFFFWEICFPFMTNNKNLGKRVKIKTIIYITQEHKNSFNWSPCTQRLTIQASSRLKRFASLLWNNSDVCRKKFGEWSPLTRLKCYNNIPFFPKMFEITTEEVFQCRC